MKLKDAAAKAATRYEAYRKSHSWRPHLAQFVALWGDRQVGSIEEEEIDAWSLRRRNEVSAATVVAEKVALKAIWKAAKLKFAFELTPIKVNNQRKSVAAAKAEEQIKKSLSAHDYDLVRFAILTGFRRAEQFRLRVKDVDFAARALTIVESKTGFGRSTPVNGEVMALMTRHCKGKAPSDYVFLTDSKANRITLGDHFVQTRCRGVFDRVCGRDFQWRDLRHTFASRLVSKGASIYCVKELMGHKNVATTQRYSHLDAKALRQTLALLE